MQLERALAGVPPSPDPALSVDFSGTWVNELGSQMTVVQSGKTLTGVYISTVSGGGRTIRGDLVGWANGHLISFVVNWPTAAVTAWAGHLVDEASTDALETLWQMPRGTRHPDAPDELWASIFAGADRFTRDPKPPTE